MSAPTIPPATSDADGNPKADVLRAEIAREAALGSDGQVAALSHSLRLLTEPHKPLSTDADYPGWTPRKPRRIQRKRTKGWTKPEGAVYVGRGSKFGNVYPLVDTQVRMPALDGSEWEHEGRLGKTSGQRHAFVHPGGRITWHQVEDATPEQVIELYRRWLAKRPAWIEDARRELAGKDLMCWCPLDKPCHADVLLEIANGSAS